MKPKPFASLNHFTVPFATCKLLLLTGASPLHHALISGAWARPPWSGLRTTNRPDTTKPQATSSAARIPNLRVGHQPPGQLLTYDYRPKCPGAQYKCGVPC